MPRHRRRLRHPYHRRQDTESLLVGFLRNRGLVITQSHDLDHVYKIDALVVQAKPLKGPFKAIGLQITQKRGDAVKIAKWLEMSVKGTDGPVIYCEVDGKVSVNMAVGLASALLQLWLDEGRALKREHGIVVHSSGMFSWFDPEAAAKRTQK